MLGKESRHCQQKCRNIDLSTGSVIHIDQECHFQNLENRIFEKRKKEEETVPCPFDDHVFVTFFFIYSNIYVWARALIINIYRNVLILLQYPEPLEENCEFTVFV